MVERKKGKPLNPEFAATARPVHQRAGLRFTVDRLLLLLVVVALLQPRASLGIPAEPVPHADSDRASRPERGSDRSGTTPPNTPPPEEDSAAAPAPSTGSVSMANTVQMTALAPWQVQRRSTVLPDADRGMGHNVLTSTYEPLASIFPPVNRHMKAGPLPLWGGRQAHLRSVRSVPVSRRPALSRLAGPGLLPLAPIRRTFNPMSWSSRQSQLGNISEQRHGTKRTWVHVAPVVPPRPDWQHQNATASSAFAVP
ncbi:unnamed protein product [Boreogadus saida]